MDMQAGPEWWKSLKPRLEKGIDDLLQRFDNDFSHGSTATRPLYYKNSFGSVRTEDDRDLVTMIDLEMILGKLFKEAIIKSTTDGPLQYRARLSILYNAAGRPGEIKFVDTANWKWHGRFELPDIVWQETKTMSIQAMPMFPDKEHFLLDFYHALGSF